LDFGETAIVKGNSRPFSPPPFNRLPILLSVLPMNIEADWVKDYSRP
jgi:hypothetical protein